MWPSVSRLPTKLGSWASSYQLERTVISQDYQPIARQYPEIGDGEKIYAAEIGKCYKSGLFTPAPAPKKPSIKHGSAQPCRYLTVCTPCLKGTQDTGERRDTF